MKSSANKERPDEHLVGTLDLGTATKGVIQGDWLNASEEEKAEVIHRIFVPYCAGRVVLEALFTWRCPVCKYKIEHEHEGMGR